MKKYLAGLVALGVLVSAPALAHHPLGGMPMTTFGHGLLSGVGHPLLGFDHLFFVVAVGIAALFTGRRLLAPLAFVAGMLGGVLLIVGGVALPAVEGVIALSLLLIGGLLARGKALGLPLAAALFAGLGLFHGWAFGETIAGQEGGAPLAVTVGYLAGLAAIQWAIAVAAGFAVGTFGRATCAAALPARLSGAMVAGAGAFLLLETFEGVLFATMGVVAG